MLTAAFPIVTVLVAFDVVPTLMVAAPVKLWMLTVAAPELEAMLTPFKAAAPPIVIVFCAFAVAEPRLMFVAEDAAPPVPKLRVFVVAAATAPVEMLVVLAAVLL